MTKKIMTVFGTRPEAIKMAPVVKALAADPDLEPITVVTGQHREMLQQVLDIFNLTPDFDLKVMEKRQSLTSITTKILAGLGPIIESVHPDMVLVHGDTATRRPRWPPRWLAFTTGCRWATSKPGCGPGISTRPTPRR